MRAALFVLLLLAVGFCLPNVARVAADNPLIPVRPVHTFSIVARVGHVDESLPLFRRVFAMDRNWITLTPRLPKSGLLPDDPKLVQKIVSVGSTRK